MTDSKSTSDSCMRFWPLSSSKTWSYSLSATQKMMEVTASKPVVSESWDHQRH
jgi:hypothetical protein